MTKLRLQSLELENQEMKSTTCALNAELVNAKKILSNNQPLVSAGAQLSKLKSINKQPLYLAVDIFYYMDRAVIPKASPEAIFLGGGLIVAGLLASIDINGNWIIYGIINYILSPSNLRYVVKKDREDTFMMIAEFVFNFPCSISCDKEERAGLVCLVKEIAFWDGE